MTAATAEGQVTRTEILPLLGVVKKQGQWLMAYCPSHDDGAKHGRNGQGMSLALSDAGVLKCMAGCDFKDVMAALRERGGERPPMRQPRNEGSRDIGELKVAYEYREPLTGSLLAVKGRFERPNPDGGKPEKSFRWRLPEGTYEKGIRDGGLTIAGMPLWGADEVISAPAGQRVWVAEGESATLAIRARNELAVCGAWGASQRDFGSAFEVLRGRDVILWPDNDTPGREYMAEVRRHLRDIARSVAVVTAPVPPKGDAVEYFAAGGTVEALLANVVVRPTVDIAGTDHFVVRIPTDAGPVAFDFDRMSKHAADLSAELTVQHLNPAFEVEPYAQRINLLSQSARSQLETALGRQFGKDTNWTTVVSTAYARARQAYLEQDRGIQIGAIGKAETLSFLVETLFPEWQPSIVFGDGSSSKTYCTYAVGAAIALGSAEVFGLAVRRRGGVLIFDYETGDQGARFRMGRVLGGMGIDPVLIDDALASLPIYYWPAAGIPLMDQIDAIERFCERHDILFLIVDSGADACGGEPEKPLAALSYFNALSRLRLTSATICHVTNVDAESSSQRPFGSRFWHNRARRTWYVKREQEEESDDLDVALLCRKVNDGRKPSPLALAIHFDGVDGPVTFRRQNFRDVVAFESEGKVADRILAFLVQQSAPVTHYEIVQGLGLANDAVKTALYRGRDKQFLQVSSGTGRGVQTRWAALAQQSVS